MEISKSTMRSAVIARAMMKEIQYDNGAVTDFLPEKYPLEWVNKIRVKVINMIILNPTFEFTEQVIEDFCAGKETEKINKYGHRGGYEDLDKVLAEYFNQL